MEKKTDNIIEIKNEYKNKMDNTDKVDETNKTDLTTESKINENVVESKMKQIKKIIKSLYQ
jgi:hypothetical protein